MSDATHEDTRLAAARLTIAEARARVWEELAYLLHLHGRAFAHACAVAVERHAFGARCEVCEGDRIVAGAVCARCQGLGWVSLRGPQ